MNKATKVLLAAAFAVTMAGAAMAGSGVSHICAYVNDNVNNSSGPNAVEGYMIGPGTATVHVGPYSTNGQGVGGGFFAGGLGATRLLHSDLYVNDAASDNITHFTINKTDCTLTLDTALYPSGDTKSASDGDGLAITPDFNTMFVGSSGDNHIYSHTIAVNGSLGTTFTEGSTPDTPSGLEVSPNGKILIVSYSDIQQVCAYPIAGGHLGMPNCQSTVGQPSGIAIDPASTCVYAGEYSGSGVSEVAAFTLTEDVLGPPNDYKPFGPGVESDGVLVNWDNEALYVSNQYSAHMTIGTIASGCKLTYKTIISDGVSGVDNPGQIAQAPIAHGYVVTGDFSGNIRPHMGIFRANVAGDLTPIGSGQFPLMKGKNGVAPMTVVVVGSE